VVKIVMEPALQEPHERLGESVDLTREAEEALGWLDAAWVCLRLAMFGSGSTFRSIGAKVFRGSFGIGLHVPECCCC